MVSLPYTVQTNDVPAYFDMKVSVPEFEQMLRRQFDVLYRESEASGRVMAIAVHPFVTGQPHRIVRARARARAHLLPLGRLARDRPGDREALPGVRFFQASMSEAREATAQAIHELAAWAAQTPRRRRSRARCSRAACA